MDQPPPYTAVEPLIRPVPRNPPVLGDITNIAVHRQRAAKRKLEYPDTVSDAELAQVIIEEHRIVQRVAGAEVAPPWFAAAIQPILDQLTAIERGQDAMKRSQDAIKTRQENAGSSRDDDVITPPKDSAQNPPASAPRTIAALKALSPQAMGEVEAYYGLPHLGSDAERSRRIAKKYGLLFYTSTSISTSLQAI